MKNICYFKKTCRKMAVFLALSGIYEICVPAYGIKSTCSADYMEIERLVKSAPLERTVKADIPLRLGYQLSVQNLYSSPRYYLESKKATQYSENNSTAVATYISKHTRNRSAPAASNSFSMDDKERMIYAQIANSSNATSVKNECTRLVNVFLNGMQRENSCFDLSSDELYHTIESLYLSAITPNGNACAEIVDTMIQYSFFYPSSYFDRDFGDQLFFLRDRFITD